MPHGEPLPRRQAGVQPQPRRIVPQLQPTLPPSCWDEPAQQPALRGPTYLADRIKVKAAGRPLLTLFAAQLVELNGASHRAGATAALIAGGALVPPPWARFVFSVYFRNPTPPATREVSAPRPHALLIHFASATRPADAAGPGSALLRELWGGPARRALSRIKLLARLHDGPTVLRTALAWAGIDAGKPLLVCRALPSTLHRTTFRTLPSLDHPLEHAEVAIDVEGSWIASSVYRAAFSAVASVDVGLTFVLEGRTPSELPEVVLAQADLRALQPRQVAWPPHASWPTDAAGPPGETCGPFARPEMDAEICDTKR